MIGKELPASLAILNATLFGFAAFLAALNLQFGLGFYVTAGIAAAYAFCAWLTWTWQEVRPLLLAWIATFAAYLYSLKFASFGFMDGGVLLVLILLYLAGGTYLTFAAYREFRAARKKR